MSDEFDTVVERVRERVSPDDDERTRLQRAASEVRRRAADAVATLPVTAEIVQVGSTARGTWTAGDRDIDVFVCFPPELDRETLESYGLEVGHAVLPEGREEYAEHPYVVGEIEGYTVDLVPCYDVADATAIQSAVDRTPFHTRYLESRLDDRLAGEVRVTKQFLKGVGVYGSDLRTRGFSGYLTELLIVEYGSFRAFLEAAADWQPPVEFDPEDHAEATFDDPLVVVDPTDPDRNVAAVCSARNVARLQHYARDLLGDPREALFTASEPEPYDAADTQAAIERRGTTPVALRFETPDIVADQLWPQLEKSLTGLTEQLERRGFDVFRSAAFADERSVLLVELAVAGRPAVERHEGPPVHVRQHAAGFYESYVDADVAGPFVDGDRYVVEREREFTTAADFLDSDAVFDVRLGPHIESALDDGYDCLVGGELTTLVPAFGVDLARYFDPKP
ncbi:CCA tRNA nucleotidyltransferase [Haloarcula montana]|uniref:CCA tRNA nucleotidyltransferase n=1 Tax=Haloarcula montana TaxID=3111776 RepID=UPI002D76EC3A|nr:CCA tRNA nucleotidyltransferase [Haloarcula sp. GH36]